MSSISQTTAAIVEAGPGPCTVAALPNTQTPILTPSKAQLSGIEALRGVAAVAVAAYHASRHVNKALEAPGLAAFFGPGQAGVDLFFTLSGFIILHVHRKDIGRPGRMALYLTRRFTRVLPLYWLALAVTVAMGVCGSLSMPSLERIVRSALLLPGWHAPLLGVAWTLQFEVLFYAAFAVLILNRRIGLAVFAAWFVCIAGTACGLATAALPQQVTGIYGIEFLFGMGSAQIMHTMGVWKPGILAGAGVSLFLVALVLGGLQVVGESGAPARIMFGVPASLIVLGLAAGDKTGVQTPPGWLSNLGNASYSIYLFQFVFIGIVWQSLRLGGLDQRIPRLVLFLVLFTSAVTGGVLTSWWIEKPMLRVLRR